MLQMPIKLLLGQLVSIFTPQHVGYVRFAKQHSNKIVSLNYTSFNLSFRIHQSGLIVLTSDDLSPSLKEDCSITFNFEAILKFIGLKPPNAKVTIEGDRTLGHGFIGLLSLQQFDPEAWLYQWLPPSLATLGVETLSGTSLMSQRICRTFKQQLHHYLVYEAGLCASKAECDQQYQDTLKLKWQLDQLTQ